jgi:hypothetical protein
MRKVLVLCQRKKSTTNKKENDEIINRVVPKINELADRLIGHDYTIEYLSDSPNKEDVDIQLYLSDQNAFEFLIRNSYALIILNTCPLQFMDYNVIYNLLENDGIMAFTSFPKLTLSSDPYKKPYEPPASLFINESTKEIYKYRKKIAGGGRLSRGGLKTRRKKQRRRLNKTNKRNAKKRD